MSGPSCTQEVEKRVKQNLIHLTNCGWEHSVFVPTETGLKKSIFDAHEQVRYHFTIEGFHDYGAQLQGPENKIIRPARLISDTTTIDSKASLYRPKTKNGDPRMWFSHIKSFAKPLDKIAIIVFQDELVLLNLSVIDLGECIEFQNEIGEILSSKQLSGSKHFQGLLDKLMRFSESPFPALKKGDTGIGYTIESMLGIEQNSSKLPDYHGIEIKSARKQASRTTLFAQVANWELSPLKSSNEILEKAGYVKEETLRLYCTVSCRGKNSQGLSLRIDGNYTRLQEYLNKDLIAVWEVEKLRQRLAEKHAETVWVQAKSSIIDSREHFKIEKITHTKKPITSQLVPLLEQGVVTMDHLIKKNPVNNRVSEKGPLFKISKDNIGLLFPNPVEYKASQLFYI